MPSKILFAVDNQKLEDALKVYLNNKYPGDYIFANIVLQRKDMIINTVYGERPDVLIVKDNLAGNEDLYSILYNLRMNYPNTRVIYICQISDEKYDSLQKYIAMGIYDIITSRSISIIDIAKLVVNPLNFSHWGSLITSNKNTIQVPNQPIMDATSVLNNTGTLKIRNNQQPVDTSSKKRVLTLVRPVSYSTGFMSRQTNEEEAEDVLFDINDKSENFSSNEFNLDDSKFDLEELSNNSIKKDNHEDLSFNLDDSETPTQEFNIPAKELFTVTTPAIKETKEEGTIMSGEKSENKLVGLTENIAQATTYQPSSVKAQEKNIIQNNRKGLYGIKMGTESETTVSSDITKRSFEIPKEYGTISSTSAELTETKKGKKQKNNSLKADKNENNETVRPKSEVIAEKPEPKSNASKAKVSQRQTVILFSEMESCSMNHTALNIAVKLAKEGKRVFYMDAIANGPFEIITNESTKVLLYDKYPITLRKFKCEKKYEYLENILMSNVSISDMFRIVKRAKQLNDAEYIIINAPMEFDIDSLIVLADKRLVLLKEDYAHADRLVKEYEYRLKYMNLVIEEHNSNYISVLSNVTPYKKQVFYLEDTKEMNFNALKNDEAAALQEDCHEYDMLVKYVI